ncbi:MAG: serine hydrolase [Actinomycetota bacterium]|nr:serine hydrolase [Actinomycetota bacterium]
MHTLDLTAVERIAGELFAPDAAHGVSLALVVMQSGVVRYERYGVQPDTIFGHGGPVTADTVLPSWSMAKSITHAAIGLLVADGLLQLDARAPVPSWKGTPKEAITLQQLLNMRSGLQWVEEYTLDSPSDVVEMLFGESSADMAGFASSRPLVHTPGEVWNYSSGTSVILSRIIGDVVGGGQAGTEAFLSERLFGPTGMASVTPQFDAVGTFVGSSFANACALDFARFGELYRTGGLAADGTRVLPASWTQHAGVFTAHDPDGGYDYGAHWWMWPEFPGSFAAQGYEYQRTLVVPDRELTVVFLGKTPEDGAEILRERLRAVVRSASNGA